MNYHKRLLSLSCIYECIFHGSHRRARVHFGVLSDDAGFDAVLAELGACAEGEGSRIIKRFLVDRKFAVDSVSLQWESGMNALLLAAHTMRPECTRILLSHAIAEVGRVYTMKARLIEAVRFAEDVVEDARVRQQQMMDERDAQQQLIDGA